MHFTSGSINNPRWLYGVLALLIAALMVAAAVALPGLTGDASAATAGPARSVIYESTDTIAYVEGDASFLAASYADDAPRRRPSVPSLARPLNSSEFELARADVAPPVTAYVTSNGAVLRVVARHSRPEVAINLANEIAGRLADGPGLRD